MKQFFVVVLFTTISTAFAQKGPAFGFKGGLNYNSNGNLIESVSSNAESPDRNIGYHLGIFAKLGNKVYFRPELLYTATKSDYDSGDFNMQKLDMPLLLGLRIFGPLSVFGGPSIQYILDSEFDDIDIQSIENDLSIGVNFGVTFNIKKIGIDLRYERGFSNNEAQFLNDNNVDISRLDTRPDQLILGLSIAIN